MDGSKPRRRDSIPLYWASYGGHDAGLRSVAVFSLNTARMVVLDFADVSVIDASGLGVCESMRKTTKADEPTTTGGSTFATHKAGLAFEVCSLAEMLDLICRASNPPRAVTD